MNGNIEAVYPYTDESGAVLFEVVRYEGKKFKQRRPDKAAIDGFNYSLAGVRRVLYHLPDIIAARENGETIFICEGEKDVAALVDRGFFATCNSGGACTAESKWLDEYTETLRGADVVIIPDNDEPGRKHAEVVAAKLQGVVHRLRRLELPGVKDAHEFFEKGGTLKAFHELIEAAPNIKPRTLVEEIEDRRFNPALNPPPVRPIYSVCGIPICTPGNLQAVNAQVKSGKSAVLGAMLSATFALDGADTLGFVSSNPDGRAVLHFDSEQARDDHWHLVNRAIRRAGVDSLPAWVQSYCFTDFGAKKNREAIWLCAATKAEEFGGIHSILIDGVADLVTDVNDPEECNEFVAALHALAIRFDCPITGIIHQNPKTDKTRGHLGSQLERKAETNLCLEKDGDIISVWSDKQRRQPILKGYGPTFQWSMEAGMHVSVEAPESKQIRDARILRDEVFADSKSYRYSELKKRVQEVTEKSAATAQRIFDKWVHLDLIEKSFGGIWIPKN